MYLLPQRRLASHGAVAQSDVQKASAQVAASKRIMTQWRYEALTERRVPGQVAIR